MDTKIKLQIDNNSDYKKYLRSNSYWYKFLNRNPESFDVFTQEVKEKYKLRTSDKISGLVEKIELISKFMNVMR
ncbi:MAG: YlbE-like family protein [Bacilli bacterium]